MKNVIWNKGCLFLIHPLNYHNTCISLFRVSSNTTSYHYKCIYILDKNGILVYKSIIHTKLLLSIIVKSLQLKPIPFRYILHKIMYISKVFKLELDFLSSLKKFPGKCNINQFLHHQNLSSLNDTSSCKLVHFSKNYYLILLILNS